MQMAVTSTQALQAFRTCSTQSFTSCLFLYATYKALKAVRMTELSIHERLARDSVAENGASMEFCVPLNGTRGV